MAHEYKFSLLLANQYSGGPVEWNEGVLITGTGAVLNYVDLTADSSKACRPATSEIISCSISPCRRFIVVLEDGMYLSISSIESGRVLCRAHVHSKSAGVPVAVSWSPCGTKIMMTRGDIAQLYYCPMKEPSYNPMQLLRTFIGSYGSVRHIAWSAKSDVVALGSDDTKVRVYPIPKIHKMPTCTTLIGCRGNIMGTWVGGKTGIDVLAIDRDGMVCTWQTDFTPDELEYDFKTTRKVMFSPQRWKQYDAQQNEIIDVDDEPENEEAEELESAPDEVGEMKDEDDDEEESSDDDEIEMIKYRRTFKDYVNQKGERASAVAAADYHPKLNILAVGHESGIFSIWEINWALDASEYGSVIQVQRLSMENMSSSLSRVRIAPKGDWLALGGGDQLIVWEWGTQSYVMQSQSQGHSVSCLAYSPCGSKLATGGTDGTVKVWSANSGFCQVTFKDHQGEVSGIAWMRSGFALATSSKDGTVRAYDLRRYRNFRTLVTPTPQRLKDVTVDPGGELIAAAGGGNGCVFVWSIRTGRLLNEFANHESDVVSINFSPVSCRLLSCSWDGSAMITDFTDQEKINREAFECPSDMLRAIWRPDGDQICTSNLSGKIMFWDPKTSSMQFEIDASRDIRAGRPKNSKVSAQTLTDQGFDQICYSSDGEFLLAGGKSFLICMYSVRARYVIGTFTLSNNMNIDGLHEFLNAKDTMTEFGALANIDDSDEVKIAGQRNKDRALRRTEGAITCQGIHCSPTGNEFAFATGEGISVFSKSRRTFASLPLNESATPGNVVKNIKAGEFGEALNMAVVINQSQFIMKVIESIPLSSVKLIVGSLPDNISLPLLTWIAGELETTKHAQIYLAWCAALLKHCAKSTYLKRKGVAAARLAARAVRQHREKILMNTYSNCATINYLMGQKQFRNVSEPIDCDVMSE